MYYAPTRALRGNHLPGQLPTAEHFNRLLSSVQRAMAGAHFKVAPLADAEEEKVPQDATGGCGRWKGHSHSQIGGFLFGATPPCQNNVWYDMDKFIHISILYYIY